MAPRTSGKVQLSKPGGVKSSAMAIGGDSSKPSKSINNYKNCSPYVSIVLGILSMTTLAWIGICQQRHIQKLGETITALCMDSPFNDPDQADRVSESGQHWD